MTDAIKYHLTLFDVTGTTDDAKSPEYIRQLATIMSCNGSNVHTRKWARSWLDEIKRQQELIQKLRNAPVPVG